MKFEKGQIIYSVVILVVVILLLFPTSTSFFNMEVNDLTDTNWNMWLPDLLGLLTVLVGYLLVKMFYKKRSKYRKWYPLLALAIGLLWTIVIQIKRV